MYYNYSKKYFILLFLIYLFISGNSVLQAQLNENLKNELLVYIKPSALTYPAEIKTSVPVSQLNIHSLKLQLVLQNLNISTIDKVFPDFSESDTVRILPEGESVKLPNLSRIFKITVPDIKNLDSAIYKLNELNDVLFAEKHTNAYLFLDDSTHKQWYLKNTGQAGGSIGEDIDAEGAWQIFSGSSGIKIAVIDCGVDLDHEDLNGKASGDSYDSYDTGRDHGTHVSGIAAAIHNNVGKIKGVDANARIVSKAIFDRNGYKGDQTAANKIIAAVNEGCHIINNSWGGTSYSTTLRFAFTYAYKYNRVATVAMGNDYLSSNPIKYPAAFGQGIIAVGATTNNGDRAPFSQTGNHIDVTAPGGESMPPQDPYGPEDIYSSIVDHDYTFFSGTSMATPQVSAIASLLKGYNTNLYNDDIEQIIRISAEDKGPAGYDIEYGTGRVNAKKALDYLRAPYVLHHKSVSGGSIHSSTDYYVAIMYGVLGLADGIYIVKRYEVRKSTNFGQTYQNTNVWGRGVGTNGFSLANPNYGMGWCDIVSNNNSSATLKTYVYKVWTTSMQYVGWKPTSPSNVSFNYTVLGEEPPVDPLSVTISGPCYLPFKASGICTANVSGGTSPISYQWYKKIDQGSWISLWTSSTQSITMGMNDITMKVVVTDNYGLTDEDTHLIETGIFKLAAGEEATLSIPDNHIVAQNYPNPFNPETQIRFGLPEDSKVTIEVFNLQGQKVATLANGYYEAGYHSVTFRGANHPSGVYFYRTVAGEFHDIKRMLLIK